MDMSWRSDKGSGIPGPRLACGRPRLDAISIVHDEPMGRLQGDDRAKLLDRPMQHLSIGRSRRWGGMC